MPGARVKIGGVDATDGSFSPTSISGIAPERPLGPADVVVTNPGGRSVTLSGGFIYHASPVITVTPTEVPPGGQLNVSWVVSLTSGFDWVGLYRLGADNVNYLSYQYLSGLSGTTTFTAPTEPGQYEFRYLPLDRYEDCARTGIVTVTASSAPISRAAPRREPTSRTHAHYVDGDDLRLSNRLRHASEGVNRSRCGVLLNPPIPSPGAY